MPLSVLLIGHGAIASYAARRIAGDSGLSADWVLCRPGREDAARASIGRNVKAVNSVHDMNTKPDLALEAAGHAGLSAHGAAVLEAGIPLGVVSIGALADDALHDELRAAAERGGTAMELLAGAIGAVDALAAAREGGLEAVHYTSRKPPGAWTGTPAEEVCDLPNLKEAVTFYEGSARAAARDYPKNANVAATVALAGLGFEETQVAMIADPAAPGNVHRIEAAGAFGRMDVTFEGKPLPDNPKSSALTAMCAVRFLRNRARPVRI